MCENTTLSAKPEIHNLLQRRQRRTEPWPQPTCTENFKFCCMVSELCEETHGQTCRQTDRQTDKQFQQTDILIIIPRTSFFCFPVIFRINAEKCCNFSGCGLFGRKNAGQTATVRECPCHATTFIGGLSNSSPSALHSRCFAMKTSFVCENFLFTKY